MNLNCCSNVVHCNIDMILLRHSIFFISVSVGVLVYLCLIYVICFFIIIFIFITINYIISLRQKSVFFGHVCQKVSRRVLLSFCLIFCQFQPGVAYESVAYKKKHVSSNCNWKKYTLMLTLNFQNCQKSVCWFAEISPALKNSWLHACFRYFQVCISNKA